MADRKLSTEKSSRILNELLKIPVNTICCDCGAANPNWASHSLGCFVCVRCCSFHRKMGVHISKMKSVTMDMWTQEEIDNMKNWGNGKVNALYLPNPERHPPPISMEGSAMEQYIRSKYERKEFMEGGGGGGGNQSSSRSAYGNTFSGGKGGNSNDIVNTQSYTTQMSALRSMGFTDNARNLQALQATNGHVADAVEILCRIGSGPVTASPSLAPSNSSSRPAGRRSPSNNNVNSSGGGAGVVTDAKENILRSMGFHDTALNREALRRAGGNPEVAAEILIDDKEKLIKAVRGDSSPASSSPLPSRLDPPGSNKKSGSDLLIDVSSPEDNQQQQQQRLLQQQQMQMMQNAFGNSNQQWPNQGVSADQFGHNQNQLQSILDKNASILALYNSDNNSNNNNNGMFGNNAMNNGAFGLQPQPTGMNTWSPGNTNIGISSSMAMNSPFQTSMPTGNNMGVNMFGSGASPMGMGMSMGMGMNMGMNNANTLQQQQQMNPFGMANQQGMGNTPGNNAFGTLGSNNMFNTPTSSINSSGFMSGTTQGMNPMAQNMAQNTGMGMNMGAGMGMGMGMNNIGGNNAFNPAFGTNQNSGGNFNTFNNGNGNPGNPWGGNSNNGNNNFF